MLHARDAAGACKGCEHTALVPYCKATHKGQLLGIGV